MSWSDLEATRQTSDAGEPANEVRAARGASLLSAARDALRGTRSKICRPCHGGGSANAALAAGPPATPPPPPARRQHKLPSPHAAAASSAT